MRIKLSSSLWLLLAAVLVAGTLAEPEGPDSDYEDEDDSAPAQPVEVLTPPYFNIAENRKVTANATCGCADPNCAVVQKEVYCKLVGYDRLDYASTFDIRDGQVLLFKGTVF